jgi:hypothetical protein
MSLAEVDLVANSRSSSSGAGIGGLTAALSLGFEVEVYEQASELREVGGGSGLRCQCELVHLQRPIIRVGRRNAFCPSELSLADYVRDRLDFGRPLSVGGSFPLNRIVGGSAHRVDQEARSNRAFALIRSGVSKPSLKHP